MNNYRSNKDIFLAKILTFSKDVSLKPGLSVMRALCKLYKNPQDAFPSIHVAGTNGKGSVCTKIAATLQNAGYKVGLYTSPHLVDYCERIQVNGQHILEQELLELYNLLEIGELKPTFFEITTLLAFIYFQKQNVDIAVIETGLGGRWDATNLITPLVSVITSIDYDHTEILGPTLKAITLEKAGIIKQKTPIVIGPNVPSSVIKKEAENLQAPFYQSLFTHQDYDLENQATAKLALELLARRFSLPQKSIEEGLKATAPCRFEEYPNIIFDVAHNSSGFKRLLQKLKYDYPHHSYRFVVGFSKEKNISECAQIIQENALSVHLVSSTHPRLSPTLQLQKSFTHPQVYLENSIKEGVKRALWLCSENELVVVAGSFFIMAEAKTALEPLN